MDVFWNGNGPAVQPTARTEDDNGGGVSDEGLVPCWKEGERVRESKKSGRPNSRREREREIEQTLHHHQYLNNNNLY
jgi:hypothetical protein